MGRLGDSSMVIRSSVGLFNSFQERGYNVQSGVLGPPFAPTVATFQDSLFFPTTPNTYETTYAFGGPTDRTEDNGGPSTGAFRRSPARLRGRVDSERAIPSRQKYGDRDFPTRAIMAYI